MADSKVQVEVLTLIVGALVNCSAFPAEDYETLVTKAFQVYSVPPLFRPFPPSGLTFLEEIDSSFSSVRNID